MMNEENSVRCVIRQYLEDEVSIDDLRTVVGDKNAHAISTYKDGFLAIHKPDADIEDIVDKIMRGIDNE